jgi:hypothetical protein
MKHEHETNNGTTSLSTKQRKIKPMQKMPIVAKLRKVTFLGCTHDNIWALDTQEETWAKKSSLVSLKKFDSTPHQ